MKISAGVLLPLFIMVSLISGERIMSQDTQGKYYTSSENVAIGGYDAVAYFVQNKAVRGSKKNEVTHDGAAFWFSSDENKNLFTENPDKYIPQYGGWCAFGMAAQNSKVPSDPRTFKLYNGKLYLFFNDYWQGEPFNTIVPWNADEAALKEKADQNWTSQR